MKVDGGIGLASSLDGIGEKARAQEDQGYDGLWVPETNHDAFTVLPLMADATEKVELGTSIVVGFARNPMSLAYSANDIQLLSEGRFILGLGSQIKPHITRRFSMEWSKPAARMREMVLAAKAIWNSWNTGEKLDFRGDFYSHTLMNPLFHPGENPWGAPRIAVAGVGELMTEVAGEVADVFLCHGFATERYLREVTIPALQRGAERAGRSLDDISISATPFIVTGNNEEELTTAAAQTKQQIAFYGSTPAYRTGARVPWLGGAANRTQPDVEEGPVGRDGRADRRRHAERFRRSRRARLDRRSEILERFDDVVDRISFYAAYEFDAARWQPVLDELKS